MGKTISPPLGRRTPEWQSRSNCKQCICREATLFGCLPEALLESIDLPIDSFSMPPRTTLFRQNEQGRYVYTVRQGLIKLVQRAPNGTPRIVGLLRRWAVAGMSALVDGSYRQTAEVLLPAEICRIPVQTVKELAAKHMPLMEQLLKRQQQDLDAANEIITLLTTGPAQGRVARCLLNTLSEAGSDHCPSMAREDLSALLSVTIETVSRTMAEFKRKGLVQERQGVFRFDREGLAVLAAE